MDQGDYIYLIINSILSSLAWGRAVRGADPVSVPADLRPTVIHLCSIPSA